MYLEFMGIPSRLAVQLKKHEGRESALKIHTATIAHMVAC